MFTCNFIHSTLRLDLLLLEPSQRAHLSCLPESSSPLMVAGWPASRVERNSLSYSRLIRLLVNKG